MIVVEATEVVPQALIRGLSEAQVNAVVESIVAGAYNEWLRLSETHPRAKTRSYRQGIQPVEIRGHEAILSLVGQPANMIEHGHGKIDLRTWLLGANVPVAPPGGRGKRQAANGKYYRSIPFRHGTPGTGGTAGATPMGRAYKGHVTDPAALGRKVYREAKKLKGPQSLRAGLAPRIHKPAVGKGKDRVPAYTHKSDLFAGMRRLRKAYGKTTAGAKAQSQYMTFRTISENVTTGWYLPPRQPANLLDGVQKYIHKVAPVAFDDYVKSLVKGTP